MYTSTSGTRNEKDFFDHCWTIANPYWSARFLGTHAVSFFSKSGLDSTVLALIWSKVDDENMGFLDRQRFDKALRLIGYAQQGFDISDPNRIWPGVLPKFDGVDFPPTSGSTSSPQQPTALLNWLTGLSSATKPPSNEFDGAFDAKLSSATKAPSSTLDSAFYADCDFGTGPSSATKAPSYDFDSAFDADFGSAFDAGPSSATKVPSSGFDAFADFGTGPSSATMPLPNDFDGAFDTGPSSATKTPKPSSATKASDDFDAAFDAGFGTGPSSATKAPSYDFDSAFDADFGSAFDTSATKALSSTFGGAFDTGTSSATQAPSYDLDSIFNVAPDRASRLSPIPRGQAHLKTNVLTKPSFTESYIKSIKDIFMSHKQEHGRISGIDASKILLKSKLPESVLGIIWDLADIQKVGSLDLLGFIIAVYYAREMKMEAISALPKELPPSVLEAVKDALEPKSGLTGTSMPPSFSDFESPPLPPASPLASLLTSLTPSTPSFAANYEAQLEEQRKLLAKIQAHQEEQAKVQKAYLEELLKQQQEQARLIQEKLEPLYNTTLGRMAQQPLGSGADLNGSLPSDIKAILDNGQQQRNIIEGYLAAISAVGSSGVDPLKTLQGLSIPGDRIPTGASGSSTGSHGSVLKENTASVAACSGARMSVPPDSGPFSSLQRRPPRAPEYGSPPSSSGTQPQLSLFSTTQQQEQQYVPPPGHSQNYPPPLPAHWYQQHPYQASGFKVQVVESGSFSNPGYVPPPQGVLDHRPTALSDRSLAPRPHIPAPAGNAQGPRAPQYRGPTTSSTPERLYRAPECHDEVQL